MKNLSKVITAALVLFCVWVTVSWGDVIMHNLDPNPQYLPFNFFDLIF